MKEKIEALKTWYATLSSESLDLIDLYYAEEAFFKDPFNEVRGRVAIKKIFTHMFETTLHPRFEFIDTLIDRDQAFLSWKFLFSLNGKAYEVIGASHLQLDASGKVMMHRDYWDPAEELWQKIPVLGIAIKWLRNKFVAK